MPPGPQRKSLSGEMVVWVLNGAGILVLVGVLAAYLSGQPSHQAASSGFLYLGGTPRPTATPVPTSFYLPTVTPNPFATPMENFASPTPFVLGGGPAPAVVGFSVLGRPIEAYSFGSGERRYLVVAGIHGGYEGNTSDLANQLIAHYAAHPDDVPADATLLLVPRMNPDGTARGRNPDGRANANGVDLNRNFPTGNWVSHWDRARCWDQRPTTGGISGGSEPETRAIMNLVAARRILALVSYHSAALGVFPGGEPWAPPSKRLAAELSDITGYPFPPVDIGCKYTGTLADWAVENGVVAAVDMELNTHEDAEFASNLKAIRALLGFSE